MLKCSRCQEERAVESFLKTAKFESRGGRGYYCVDCRAVIKRDYYDRTRPRPIEEKRHCKVCDSEFVWNSMHGKQETCSKYCYEQKKQTEKPEEEVVVLFRQGLKRCSADNAVLPLGEFRKRNTGKTGRVSMCREHEREYQGKWAKENIDSRRETWKAYTRSKRWKEFNFTGSQFQDALEACDFKCQICGKIYPPKSGRSGVTLIPDHCHDRLVFRGVLCSTCNSAIGHLYDNPDLCRAAAKYLEERNV